MGTIIVTFDDTNNELLLSGAEVLVSYLCYLHEVYLTTFKTVQPYCQFGIHQTTILLKLVMVVQYLWKRVLEDKLKKKKSSLWLPNHQYDLNKFQFVLKTQFHLVTSLTDKLTRKD